MLRTKMRRSTPHRGGISPELCWHRNAQEGKSNLYSDRRRQAEEARVRAERIGWEVARDQWAELINPGIGPADFGEGFVSAPYGGIDQSERSAGTNAESNGSAGLGERRLDDERFPGDGKFIHEVTLGNKDVTTLIFAFANEIRGDGDSTLASDSHAVQTQSNSWLGIGQHESVFHIAGVQSMEADVRHDGPLVDYSTIGITDIDLHRSRSLRSRNLSF